MIIDKTIHKKQKYFAVPAHKILKLENNYRES